MTDLVSLTTLFAVGFQFVIVVRCETVCERPTFNEDEIIITPNQTNYTEYQVVEFSCRGNLEDLTGGYDRVTCQPSGSWAAPGSIECDLESCTNSLNCLDPCSLNSLEDDVDIDVKVVGEGQLVGSGTTVMFLCNGTLVGNPALTCSDSVWDKEFPQCSAECRLEDLASYSVSANSTVTTRQDGEMFTYQCGSESVSAICDDGTWSIDDECIITTTPTSSIVTKSTLGLTTTEEATKTLPSTDASTTDETTMDVSTTGTSETTNTPTKDVTTEFSTPTGTTQVPTTNQSKDASTTIEATKIMTTSTTTKIPTSTETANLLTTTEITQVLTKTDSDELSTLITMLIEDFSTDGETNTTAALSSIGSSTGFNRSTATPDFAITSAVFTTTESPCSYCTFTVEYCGEDNTCRCRPGSFRTQTDGCIRSRTFYTSMTISEYHGTAASLSLINNTEDKETLRGVIVTLTNSALENERDDYYGCEVFRLRAGSIVADIVTYFNISTSLNETRVNEVITDGFESQNQTAIVIVPNRTVTLGEFDECTLMLDDCHERAICNDTADFFTCSCVDNTIDQLEGGLEGRLCIEPPASPSPSPQMESTLESSTVKELKETSITIIPIILVAVVVLFLILVCCLAWINNTLLGRPRDGFDLKAAPSESSIKILGIVEKQDSPVDGDSFKIEINEGEGPLNSTSVEAAQVLGTSVYNPIYESGADVEPPHEMTTVHTSGGDSDTRDVAMNEPAYTDPDKMDPATDDKIPAERGDGSSENSKSDGLGETININIAGYTDAIYAKPVPKNDRTSSFKDNTPQKEDESGGHRGSVGLGDLASTMAEFPTPGAKRLSLMFEEEATEL